jgi:hypothetical protein
MGPSCSATLANVIGSPLISSLLGRDTYEGVNDSKNVLPSSSPEAAKQPPSRRFAAYRSENARFRDSSVACLWRPLEGGVSCPKSRPKITVPILPHCWRVLKLASLEHRSSFPRRVLHYRASGARSTSRNCLANRPGNRTPCKGRSLLPLAGRKR